MKGNSLKEHQDAIYTILCEMDRVCKELDIHYYLFAGTLLGAIRHQGFIPWDDDLDIAMKREDYKKFMKYGNTVLNQKDFFLQEEFSVHWPVHFSKLRMNGTTCLEKFHPKDPKVHQGVYIDIFPIDNASNQGWIRKLQFYASKVVIGKALFNRGYETNSSLKKIFIQVCRFLPTKLFNRFVRMENKQTKYVHSFYGASSKMEKSVYPASIFEETVQVKFNTSYFPAPKQYDALLTILYGDYRKLPSQEERKVKKHAILVDLTNSYEKYEHYRDDMEFEIHTRSIR